MPILCRVSSPPSGTVTFLFTDVEGSTRLLQEWGDRYGAELEAHRCLLREAFGRHQGFEVDTQGDAFFVAFARAQDAARGAYDAQRALMMRMWPGGRVLRVRMGFTPARPRRRRMAISGRASTAARGSARPATADKFSSRTRHAICSRRRRPNSGCATLASTG